VRSELKEKCHEQKHVMVYQLLVMSRGLEYNFNQKWKWRSQD